MFDRKQESLDSHLIVIDQSEQDVCRIRHVGDSDRLATEFVVGFKRALSKVDHFVKAWDAACEDEVSNSCTLVVGEKMPTLRESLIEAAIMGLIRQELVPVVGRKEHAAKQVLRMWEEDDSGAKLAHGGANRAALANAFTRYAHQVAAQSDPWIEDEIQQAAGRLLYGKGEMKRIPLVVPA